MSFCIADPKSVARASHACTGAAARATLRYLTATTMVMITRVVVGVMMPMEIMAARQGSDEQC
jgi:hypothetical protein